jgi:hypothetical protein
MVASTDTVREVYRILCKHCTHEQVQNMLSQLQKVRGNKSFRDTVANLLELHKSAAC